MRPGRNFLAGLANSVWSALVGLTVVPLYLKYLGIEAYGLIGFFATLQAFFQILDLGFASTISRELARYSAIGKLSRARNLLHTLAIIYWSTAATIATFLLAIAPYISEYWLQSKDLPKETLTISVMMMALVAACRWPIGLYQGALMGAQRLTVLSGLNIVMTTLGSFGAAAVLAFVSPTINAFFLWQAGTGLAYAVTIRWAAWKVVGRPADVQFDRDELKRVWRFSVGMSGIALSALVFTQLGKIVLSKVLNLEEFGHYTLATVVVSGLYVLITPMFNTMYPRFSALVVEGNTERLIDSYRLGTRLLAAMLFPITIMLVIFAEDLVRLWTGNPDIAISVAPIIGLLAAGSALHGVMHFPYALQIAHGMTRLPLAINAILMIVLIPLTLFFALSYRALGGAMAWLVLHVLYLIIGTWMTHRHLLKGVGRKWLLEDVGIPFTLSLLAGIAATAVRRAGYPVYIELLCAGALALLASLLTLAVSPRLRFVLAKGLGWNEV